MAQEGDSESPAALREGLKSLAEAVSDLKDRVREIERRARALETDEIDKMKKCLYGLENHVSNIRTVDDARKERWNMALNFVVQLIWVVMAGFVLTKLGIGMGPL
jgi:predicted nuclease with TOPRIM domain